MIINQLRVTGTLTAFYKEGEVRGYVGLRRKSKNRNREHSHLPEKSQPCREQQVRTEIFVSFGFHMKMSLLVILLGVLLRCCVFGVSDEHGKLAGNHTLGATATDVMNMPLTLSPEDNIRQFQGNYPFPSPGYRPQRCPLCDSSIYPYCGEKLLHDACCCTDSHDLPYQCKLADCQFLHANSCREHRLIANCCCSDDYRAVLKSFVQA